MAERTHVFYLDEALCHETELKKGDRLVFAGGAYCVIRDGMALFCKQADKPVDNEFTMGVQLNPIYGALDIARMFNLSPRITAEKLVGGEFEWLLD